MVESEGLFCGKLQRFVGDFSNSRVNLRTFPSRFDLFDLPKTI